MKESIIPRVAVIILAIVLAIFGVYHFQNARDMIGFLPNFLPGGIIWVYLVGVAFILAAIALFAHKMVKVAGYALAVLLIIFVLTIHLPNAINGSNKEARQSATTNVLKDLAIAAFAMYIASNAKKI